MQGSNLKKSAGFSIESLINDKNKNELSTNLELINDNLDANQKNQLPLLTNLTSPSSIISHNMTHFKSSLKNTDSNMNTTLNTFDSEKSIKIIPLIKQSLKNDSEQSASSNLLSCSPTLSSSSSSLSSSSLSWSNQESSSGLSKLNNRSNCVSAHDGRIMNSQSEENVNNLFSNHANEMHKQNLMMSQNQPTNTTWPLSSVPFQQALNQSNYHQHQQVLSQSPIMTMDSQLSAIQFHLQREQTFNMLRNGARFFDPRFNLPRKNHFSFFLTETRYFIILIF
jgi:hypothetical protein